MRIADERDPRSKNAGIVDKHVQPAVTAERQIHQGTGLAGRSDIRDARGGLASGSVNRRTGRAKFLAGSCAQHHARALACKELGRGAADAAAGSRDDDDGVSDTDTMSFGGRLRDSPA